MNQSKQQNHLPQATDGIIGKIFDSNNYGRFKVVAKSGRAKSGHKLYKVRFVATDYEMEAIKGNIKRGTLKDPHAPSVVDVGYLGGATSREGGVKKPSYQVWAAMLNRCFNPDVSDYDNYGGRGIRVCERWHSFEHYENDIRLLAGYEDPKRDTIGRINNDEGYSPGNCRWATMKTQCGNRRTQKNQREFNALSPSNNSYKGSNQAQFAREHGLCNSGISKCLRGKQKTHKGWRFEFVEVNQGGSK